jgi:hypothetical protein
MRTAAAIPTVGLLAGCAVGLIASDLCPISAAIVLCVAATVGVWAWCASRALVLGVAVCVAFAGGGAALAASGW